MAIKFDEGGQVLASVAPAEGLASEEKQDDIIAGLADLLAELQAEQALTWATGAVASSGDNDLIAAPSAGQQHKIRAIQWQNETTTATTSILKFGTVAKWRLRAKDDGNGVLLVLRKGEEWAVGDGLALKLNLSGANSHGYSVAYYTEAI